MLEQAYFDPWVGNEYDSAANKSPRLLVIGESRYDAEFTDRQIIQDRMGGKRSRTFTNFVQAATGVRHRDPFYDEPKFSRSTVFYNYNTTFLPGTARNPLPWNERENPANAH